MCYKKLFEVKKLVESLLMPGEELSFWVVCQLFFQVGCWVIWVVGVYTGRDFFSKFFGVLWCTEREYVFGSSFVGRGYVYNVVGCHVIPVDCGQISEVKMQQSTKWMWMVGQDMSHVTSIVL